MPRRWLLGVILVGLPLLAAAPNPPSPDAADLERLRAASLPTDGPALEEFLLKQILKEVDRPRVEALIRRLGDDDFAARERASRGLVAEGPSARPLLREATRDPDREIAHRAEECLLRIDRASTPEILTAAVRVLARRRQAGTAAALLAFVPAADDPTLIEEVHHALAAVAVRDGKPEPVLLEALADRDARKRAAAGEALGLSSPEARPAVRRLLRDADPRVRYRVALALVEARDKEAVPVLIALLAEPAGVDTDRVEETLCLVAGDDVPAAADDLDARKRRAGWQAWWSARGAALDLSRLDRPTRSLGYTLLAQVSQAALAETDAAGRVRWQLEGLHYPIDAQVIDDNRVLVSEYTSRTVSERNFKGEVLWEKTVPTLLLGARRLPNGRTFVVTRSRLFETDGAGKESNVIDRPNDIVAACRLRTGHTVLVTTSGQCVRLDASGKEVKSFPVGVLLSIGSNIDVRPGGHVVVPLYSRNQVVEFDAEGKVVWSVAVARPSSVQRLPNGHTLVASRVGKAVVEFDRRGDEVWRLATTGRTLRAVRR